MTLLWIASLTDTERCGAQGHTHTNYFRSSLSVLLFCRFRFLALGATSAQIVEIVKPKFVSLQENHGKRHSFVPWYMDGV